MRASLGRDAATTWRGVLLGALMVTAMAGCSPPRSRGGSSGDAALDDDAGAPLDAPDDTGSPPDDAVSPPDDAGPSPDDVGSVPCTSSRQCSAMNLVCDTAQGLCVECVGDPDCMAGTQYCAAGGRCAPRECIETDVRCVAGVREVCNPRGTGYVAMPCTTQQSCVDGACVDRACTPGVRRCVTGDPTRVEACDAEGLGYTPSPCPMGQSCADGACVPYRCIPNGTRCAGTAAVQTCDGAGLAFGPATPCPAGQGCDAAAGACRALVCSPGTATCLDANTRRVCDPDGLGYTSTACASAQTCNGGVCVARACVPGTFACADATTRGVCNPDGLGYAVSPCPAMQACVGGGVCTPWVCTPGSVGTACPNATSQQVCAPDGQGFATVACPSGQVCMGGRCSAPCGAAGQPVCASGQCNSGLAACAGVCRNTSTDATACGPTCTACPVPTQGTARCTAGTCEVVCNDRFNPSAGACVACGADGQPACVAGSPCNAGTVNMAGTCRGCVGAVVSVGSYEDGACAALSGGAVRCWGRNQMGQLGNGTTTNSLVPVDVTGLSNAVEVQGGYQHNCARLANGTVWCWGNNTYGQVGNGTTTSRATPAQVSGFASGATSLAVGHYHTCAVVNGGVRCWGYNTYGQLGDGGSSSRSTPVSLTDLSSGVVQVVAGAYHTCALLATGAARCWGYNYYGALGDGTTTTRARSAAVSGLSVGVVRLFAGKYHTCAVLAAGGVRCWGQNDQGQLGNGTFTNASTPRDVTGITTAVEGAAGRSHACVRLADGTMRCWGSNAQGQLGTGTVTSSPIPVSVSMLGGVTSLNSYDLATCAVASGAARCWGYNGYGHVGDGTTTRRTVPTPVANLGGGGGC